MNLNGLQIALIIAALLSGITGATAQLTDIFGAVVAKDVVSLAALLNMLLSSILVPYTSQRSQVQSVVAMPGIEHITVNSQANQSLATMAIDPKVDKIAPTQASLIDVTKTAQGI